MDDQATPAPGSINILFINNDGTGFAERLAVPVGTTVGQMVHKYGSGNERDYTITVNREMTTRDRVLAEGDRVSLAPSKMTGAIS